MTEIELWESEIEESNRFHFFEDANRILDFLSESVEMDYKLLEMGLLTEADEEDTDSEDTGSEESKDETKSDSGNKDAGIKFKEKLSIFFKRLLGAVVELVLKARKFLKEKVNEVKQKHIVEKFKNGKYDTDKMVEKINKTALFDPSILYDYFIRKGIFGEYFGEFFGEPLISTAYTNIPMIDKYIALCARLSSLDVAKDAEGTFKYTEGDDKGKPVPVKAKINPSNAKEDIVKLYEQTNKYLEEINKKVEGLKKDIEKKEKETKDLKDKKDIKAAKGALTLYKSWFKGAQRVYKMFLQQSNTLIGLMATFGVKPEKEESKEEESKES